MSLPDRRLVFAQLATGAAFLLGPPLAELSPEAAPTAVPAPFELLHGVIVDPARGAAYLAEPAGGLEAVDLRTGRSRWKSAAAALPLALHDRLLVAQVEEAKPGRLPIVILDAGAGGRKVKDAAIPLPADVHALVTDALGRSFRAAAEQVKDGFLVSWSYKETQIAGIATEQPPPERRFSGAARLDLNTGRVVAADAATPSPRPPFPEPLEGMVGSKSLPRAPWQAGAVFAITVGSGETGHERLVLKRWTANKGQSLPDVTLLDGLPLVEYPSADRRHLLLVRRSEAGRPIGEEYIWSVFSLETGERAAEIRHATSAVPFCVVGSRLIHQAQPGGRRVNEHWVEKPLRIRAVDIKTGTEAWERPLRDTAFRGQYPPRPSTDVRRPGEGRD